MKTVPRLIFQVIFLSIILLQTAIASAQLPPPPPPLTVHLHFSGYTGNFYYLSDGGLTQNWFYGDNSGNAKTITLYAGKDSTYNLFISGYDNLGFVIHNNIVSLSTGQTGAIQLVNNPAISNDIDVTFNTALIKIETSGLSLPYMFSAYALVPGQTNTNGANYRALSGNISAKLIVGMNYAINSQAYIYLLSKLFKRDTNNKNMLFYDTLTYTAPHCRHRRPLQYQDDLRFFVNPDGTVTVLDAASATAVGNKLIFKTSYVDLDPSFISKGIPLNYVVDYETTAILQTPRIKVIDGVLNHIWWFDAKCNRRNDYYYIKNPPIIK